MILDAGDVVLLWVIGAAGIAMVARVGGRSGGLTFLICLVFSPLLGVLITFLLPKEERRAGSGKVQPVRPLPPVPTDEEPEELPSDEQLSVLEELRRRRGENE